MKIIPLSEGAFTVDITKTFVPFNPSSDNLRDRSPGSLLVEIQPFAVATSKEVILIDTGLGFVNNGEPQLHRNLKANNIDPAKVTKVLISHLHKDHSGGITTSDRLGHVQLSFPNATYYVQQKELEYAIETGYPSFATSELSLLNDNSMVQVLTGDGVIDGYITCRITGGHSPYHQVFWIEEAGEIVFFGGDVAPQLQQMKSRFAAKYDFDGKRSMELRQEWWKRGQAENWKFLFYHDIKSPVWPVE